MAVAPRRPRSARTPAAPAGDDTAPEVPSRLPALDLAGVERLAREHLAGEAERDVDLFVLRLRRFWPDVVDGLAVPYGGQPSYGAVIRAIVTTLADAYRARSNELRLLDLERSLSPDWFQSPAMIGYVCYVDRFADSLAGIEDHVDHLEALGVEYLHLMPLLRPRPGDSDGGYAVADYRAVDPRLGSMEDLAHLCRRLHERRISVCIDFVLNHTAAEHEWAVRARKGDPDASARYWIFPDRTMPDRYEATLPEVFPEFAPGNFTRLADGRWVWTTFNAFQWDLNWSHPRVFVDMLETLLWLANQGVDIFRLDAIAFIWKRLGTDCQNQPEVHDLVMALRACGRIVAPAILFKAEAIVGPDQLAPYLGVGRRYARECDLAYHNSLMVQFWSAIATRDARLATLALAEFPHKPASTAWATYIRCHDDIGWAIADDDAENVGWDGRAHRAFLSEFYAGRFEGSFARGVVFQHNPATNDSRISGSFASLAGLERALELGDPAEVDLAIGRILLGHALILGWDGLPLLYMGDELGTLNDPSYADDPAHAADNRWIHRPRMDWSAAARRADPRSPEGRIFGGLTRLIAARRRSPQLHAAAPLEILDPGTARLFAFVRRHPLGSLLAVHNVTDTDARVPGWLLGAAGLATALDAIAGDHPVRAGRDIVLPPYAVRWWSAPADVLG